MIYTLIENLNEMENFHYRFGKCLNFQFAAYFKLLTVGAITYHIDWNLLWKLLYFLSQ